MHRRVDAHTSRIGLHNDHMHTTVRLTIIGRKLCLHILYAMLKVLRLPPTSPLVWQLSLIDSEISDMLSRRHLIRNRRRDRERQMMEEYQHASRSFFFSPIASSLGSSASSTSSVLAAPPSASAASHSLSSLNDNQCSGIVSVARRGIDEGDSCPICFEDMERRRESESEHEDSDEGQGNDNNPNDRIKERGNGNGQDSDNGNAEGNTASMENDAKSGDSLSSASIGCTMAGHQLYPSFSHRLPHKRAAKANTKTRPAERGNRREGRERRPRDRRGSINESNGAHSTENNRSGSTGGNGTMSLSMSRNTRGEGDGDGSNGQIQYMTRAMISVSHQHLRPSFMHPPNAHNHTTHGSYFGKTACSSDENSKDNGNDNGCRKGSSKRKLKLVPPDEVLAWCRHGCGNNIHAKCMQVWGQHRRSKGRWLSPTMKVSTRSPTNSGHICMHSQWTMVWNECIRGLNMCV